MADRETELLDLLREVRASLAPHEPPLSARTIELMRIGAGELAEHASGETEGRELGLHADRLELWLRLERTVAAESLRPRSPAPIVARNTSVLSAKDLRALRVAAGWSVQQLAIATDLSPITIRAYESQGASRRASAKIVEALSKPASPSSSEDVR